ncbi:hypothetical protein BS50DRAFT_63670 [Corynespora cassiicola Philippines]|uniref:Uncharacterized protein n=1 Tax=Corynespora cassiicola Philippines TaxID=1448308 RepID=A0A2T2NK66_CORCC|nr:hypothetical protein BS50DRAFT_63670 [Corynespora cassiicola Philippines]
MKTRRAAATTTTIRKRKWNLFRSDDPLVPCRRPRRHHRILRTEIRMCDFPCPSRSSALTRFHLREKSTQAERAVSLEADGWSLVGWRAFEAASQWQTLDARNTWNRGTLHAVHYSPNTNACGCSELCLIFPLDNEPCTSVLSSRPFGMRSISSVSPSRKWKEPRSVM